MGLLGLSLLFAPELHAACPAPGTAAELERALAAEDEALAALDSPLFLARVEATRQLIPCLGERITPSLAAGLHTREAMRTLIQGDAQGAVLWSRAALAADPGFRLDPALLPEGHPLWDSRAAAAALGPPAVEAVPLAPGLSLWVNGAAANTRPVDVPAVLQVGTEDAVRWSAVLAPGEPVPEALRPPLAPPRAPPPDPNADPPPPPPPRAGWALAISAGGAALGSAGLYALALQSEHQFKTPEEVDDSLEDLTAARRRTNTLTAGSGALGAAALGLGVGAALAF